MASLKEKKIIVKMKENHIISISICELCSFSLFKMNTERRKDHPFQTEMLLINFRMSYVEITHARRMKFRVNERHTAERAREINSVVHWTLGCSKNLWPLLNTQNRYLIAIFHLFYTHVLLLLLLLPLLYYLDITVRLLVYSVKVVGKCSCCFRLLMLLLLLLFVCVCFFLLPVYFIFLFIFSVLPSSIGK